MYNCHGKIKSFSFGRLGETYKHMQFASFKPDFVLDYIVFLL